MTDTIENFTREGTFGKSWKNRFHNKWPTMTTLMEQSEITIQPYLHEYTDPHEIMAYRTCKIPDWDGSSEASWSASRCIQQEILEDSSATEIAESTKVKGRQCEKTCRNVLCVVLILSVGMAIAAVVGLSVFLNLHDHGLAEHRGHHHGNHIHSNLTTDQGIYLSKLFCRVVKGLLRGTDFPVERGLRSCHTALLFIENSEDLHIEMHVSPTKGYTIKEKILRALKEGIFTDQNSWLKEKEKQNTNFANEIRKGYSTPRPRTIGSQSTLSRVVYTEKYDNVDGTTSDPASTRHSTNDAALHESSTEGKEGGGPSVRPLAVSNSTPTEQNVSTATASHHLLSSQFLSDSASSTTLPSIITFKGSTPAGTDPMVNMKTTSLPPIIFEHDPNLLDTNFLYEISSSPVVLENKSASLETNYLDKTISIPSIRVENNLNPPEMNYYYKTSSVPSVSVDDVSKFLDRDYLYKTTSLPTGTVDGVSKQSDMNYLDKTPPLPPISVDDMSKQSDTNNLDKTTSFSPIPVDDMSKQSGMNYLDKTISLSPVPVDDMSIQSGMGYLDKGTSLSPVPVDDISNQLGMNHLEKTTSLPLVPIDVLKQSDMNYLDKTTSLPPIPVNDVSKLLDTNYLDKTTSLPPIPANMLKQSGMNYLDKTTSRPQVPIDGVSKPLDTNYLDKTTFLPPFTIDDVSKLMDMNYFHKTKVLPPIFVEHDQVILDKNVLDRTASFPLVSKKDPIQLDKKSQNRSKSITSMSIEHDPSQISIKSSFEQTQNQAWNEIPIVTKLFNPEPLDLTDEYIKENDISNSNKGNVVKSANSKSPKIVESLMSGGVMKLPFKTNSNFRFLFSSDSKVKNTNKNNFGKPEIIENNNFKELSNSKSSHNKNKENLNTQKDQGFGHTASNLITKKPRSPNLFRTIRLPTPSTKSFIQRKTELPKKPKRRLDLTEFGEPSLVFR